tara:strand:+ start:860 stop:1792 length:933 start_codon:yes stop_codon:yes gene_type:complete
MKEVLILGGCGYIGSALRNYLKGKYNTTTMDLEWYGYADNRRNILRDYCNLRRGEAKKYDVIVLLAGHSSVKMCENNMLSTMRNNVLNFVELIEKITPEQTFIYASSSSVYGDTKEAVVDEKHTHFEPNNFYDLSKYEIDAYAQLSDKKYFGLRFGTVNGSSPNLRNDIMINAMTFNGLKNNKVFCFNPQIHRPILGIKDLCRAINTIVEKGTFENRGIYNVASFNSTAKEIAEKVASVIGVDLETIETLPETITNVKLQTNAYNFRIDSTKFINTFDFKFEEDVESIVSSILEDFDNINKENRSIAKSY